MGRNFPIRRKPQSRSSCSNIQRANIPQRCHDIARERKRPLALQSLFAKELIATDRIPPMSHATGSPTVDNTNIQTAGPRGPTLLQDIWLIEKLAHFDREVIPERRVHAKGWGAHGTFTVTNDITRYTKAKIFSEIGKKTPMFARFSTVASERGAADAERDIRGFA